MGCDGCSGRDMWSRDVLILVKTSVETYSAANGGGDKHAAGATINSTYAIDSINAKDSSVVIDSTKAIDSTNAKDSTAIPLERKMGCSGCRVCASIKSENKQKRLKSVATKGKVKEVEKGVKEKQNVKFEDPDGEDGGLNLGDEVQGSKSVVYGTFRNRMSPSSVINVAKKLRKIS
uniref:Uncharacterized protein n=1 Tax=Chenopodium quinoa TaxID=63459 RepID=A0A803L382_CHEQI